MFGIHETFGAYIDDSLIAVLATLGSFGKLVDIGLLAIIVFSMFRCEKITVLVSKGQVKNVSLEEMIKKFNQLCSRR